MEELAILTRLFKQLGLPLDRRTFQGRLRIQKLVYLLRLRRSLAKYLPYKYDMYFHGPYSTELARAIYSIGDGDVGQSIELEIGEGDLEYAQYINIYTNKELEILTALVELIKRYQTRDVATLTWHLKGIRRDITREEVGKALEQLETLEKTFDIDIYR